MSAQRFSTQEARKVVDSLHAAGLLSDYGRVALSEQVEGGWAPIFTPRRVYSDEYAGRGDSLSAAQLLGMLYQAYLRAYTDRLVVEAESEVMEEWQLRGDFNMDMVTQPAFRAAVEQRRMEHPGFRFERAVLEAARADTTIRWAAWTDSWTAFEVVSDTLVPANRSISGIQVGETLEAVYAVGLIGRDTFDRYRTELTEAGIYPDHYLLKRLAEAAGTRETEEKRIRDRKDAIELLGKRGLIARHRVPALLRDSALLRTLDDRALYRYVEPQLTLSLTEPSGPEELVEQFRRQLCDFDPQLCALRIELLEDTADATDAYTRYWLVGTHEDWRSERSTEIYTYSADDGTPWYQVYSADPFLQPFNAYLASVNAPYRLFNLSLDPAEAAGGRIGLQVFPLTSAAARALDHPDLRDAMDFLHGPEIATFFSAQEATGILDSLEALGFLRPLDRPQIEAARGCMKSRTLTGLTDLFRCLPGLHYLSAGRNEREDGAELQALDHLPGKLYVVPASAFDMRNVYVKLEPEVAAFLAERFPFGLRPL